MNVINQITDVITRSAKKEPHAVSLALSPTVRDVRIIQLEQKVKPNQKSIFEGRVWTTHAQPQLRR